MSDLKIKALGAFSPDDPPMLIIDHYDDLHFGSGMVEYIFHGLVVRITNDRSDIYGDIGLVGEGLVSIEKVIAKTHPDARTAPEVRSAVGISRYVQANFSRILELLNSNR
ncbi:MAG: hypothetical protein WDN01_07020 [Rhizomicrobium sp.]